MYRFDKCMILKVTKQLFHRYFLCSEFKKNVASPKALILRHVHVQVYVLMYISTWTGTCTSVHVSYVYISICTGKCTYVQVRVHQYMSWCALICICTDVHVHMQNMKIYMIRKKKQGTWTWKWKSIALKCNTTIKVMDLVSKNLWLR